MKKFLLLLTFASQMLAAQAQANSETEPYVTKALSADAIQTVEARTQGGSITVKGGYSTDARVEVFVGPNNSSDRLSKEEIEKRLQEDYTLSITVTNHALTAVAKPKHQVFNWKRSLSISFRIYVPVNVSTNVETSGGSISLNNLAGHQKFSTSGGSLHVVQVTGKTTGSTSGGSIYVSDSKDEIDLSTSGGSIEASNCSGQIKLETSGGSLHLLNLKGVIHAETSGGSAEGSNIDGELYVETSGSGIRLSNLSCSLDASTSGASIQVTMVKIGKFIKLGTSGGNIDLQMPQGNGLNLDIDAGSIKTNGLTNFSGSQERGKMKGTVNGGGIPVTLNTSGGRVSLTAN